MKTWLCGLVLVACFALAPQKVQAQYGVVYSVGYPVPVAPAPVVSYSVGYAPAPVVYRSSYVAARPVYRPVVAAPVYRAAYRPVVPVYRPAYRPVIAPVRPFPIVRPRLVVPAVFPY